MSSVAPNLKQNLRMGRVQSVVCIPSALNDRRPTLRVQWAVKGISGLKTEMNFSANCDISFRDEERFRTQTTELAKNGID